MTQAQAATVAKDLIAAGYTVNAVRQPNDSYLVSVVSKDGPVDASAVASFAASHSVVARMSSVELV